MIAMDLIIDGTLEASGPDFDAATAIHIKDPIAVIGMPNGTVEGRPSVILRVPLPSGGEVWIETSLRLFVTAADALRAHYGDPRAT